MAVSNKHKFTSPKADGADATLVRPSNWNDEHDLTMDSGFVLGRTSAGNGPVEETKVTTALLDDGAVTTAKIGDSQVTTAKIGDSQVTTAKLAAGVAVPAGTVLFLAQNTAPTGYLKANGAAVSRSTYAALFAAISTTYGAGDGSTTFNLPDLRGEFMRGWDDGRGVDSGRAFGSAQAGEIQSHRHNVTWTQFFAAAGGSSVVGTIPGGSFNAADGTGLTGGSETRPRNVALLAVIKF